SYIVCSFPPSPSSSPFLFFLFISSATTQIYTLSLHDALPISPFESRTRNRCGLRNSLRPFIGTFSEGGYFTEIGAMISQKVTLIDRKSTRLNSSHGSISYAVFCLKKKKKKNKY